MTDQPQITISIPAQDLLRLLTVLEGEIINLSQLEAQFGDPSPEEMREYRALVRETCELGALKAKYDRFLDSLDH